MIIFLPGKIGKKNFRHRQTYISYMISWKVTAWYPIQLTHRCHRWDPPFIPCNPWQQDPKDELPQAQTEFLCASRLFLKRNQGLSTVSNSFNLYRPLFKRQTHTLKQRRDYHTFLTKLSPTKPSAHFSKWSHVKHTDKEIFNKAIHMECHVQSSMIHVLKRGLIHSLCDSQTFLLDFDMAFFEITKFLTNFCRKLWAPEKTLPFYSSLRGIRSSKANDMICPTLNGCNDLTKSHPSFVFVKKCYLIMECFAFATLPPPLKK